MAHFVLLNDEVNKLCKAGKKRLKNTNKRAKCSKHKSRIRPAASLSCSSRQTENMPQRTYKFQWGDHERILKRIDGIRESVHRAYEQYEIQFQTTKLFINPRGLSYENKCSSSRKPIENFNLQTKKQTILKY